MALRFQNQTMRASWWDYSNSGTYFITICTKNKSRFFGKIQEGEIQLSEVGVIALEEWLNTKELRQRMRVELHQFVVMPDHFHALITIGESEFNGKNQNVTELGSIKNNEFKSQSNNLASVVRGFKSAVTTRCKKLGIEFQWQSRYHDIIVRNSEQFERIEKYIRDNPQNYKSK
ncbi:transposase [Fluviicola taffensis]|uniref:Transposase IS200-like domain-containing protein n=1 Tax=Fluviicola taffensis (strain DSM 16823 / NCIMB 13979 / RW262) TaxID=755732 RepID=F2IAG0_FLUTR|nr:transposase [Fluviicola taffensis]AEA43096.1 hypothetical protein Fluta_1099 [Fluviicola taffensis DSM 16823]